MPSKLSNETFLKRVYEIWGDEFSVLNEYINAKTKISVRHNSCGNQYIVLPFNLLSGHSCNLCANKIRANSRSSNPEVFSKFFYEIVGDEYTLLSEYKRSNIKVLVRHNSCNNSYATTPSNFSDGKRCPFCSVLKKGASQRGNIEDFKIYVEERYSGEYIVVGKEYINARTKIEILHTKCGEIWNVCPDKFKNSRECPNCKRTSKGERSISSILEKLKFSFIKQYRFKNCFDKGVLPFDFYIPEFNMCIEYQGEQHYRPVSIFGGEDSFKSQVKRDKIKKKYCKSNNIELLIIPYWKIEDAEKILTKKLRREICL